LVGPSSLARLADAAAVAGLRVSLPDLTSVAESDSPHDVFCGLAVDAGRKMETAPLVVGHSGAGVFLPAIGSAIGDVAGLVFVDAVVPPAEGVHSTSPPMREMLDSVTEAGVLRRWLSWWPEETIVGLLPYEADRAELEADMPRVPRSFYDHDVKVPPGWSRGRCAYLMLSNAYETELHDAAERGWPTARLDSHHLAPLSQPDSVLGEVLQLARRIV
jgi:hypothetical protein